MLVISKRIQSLLALSIFSIVLSGCQDFVKPTITEELVTQPVVIEQPAPINIEREAQLSSCEQMEPVTIVKIVEKPCPVISSEKLKIVKPSTAKKLQMIGRIEYVTIDKSSLTVKARIDTGAKTSSLNALDLKEFERDKQKWVRFAIIDPESKENIYFERPVKHFVRIKQMLTENQRRPVVEMILGLGQIEETIDVTLTDRSDYVYQLLIGRNFLLDRMVVDVSKKYLHTPQVK